MTDDVGYGRPPKGHQFKKGRSGNPGGRPRKKPKAEAVSVLGQDYINDIFRDEAQRPVHVKENGKIFEMTKMQVIVRAKLDAAVRGNGKAQTEVIKTMAAMQESHMSRLGGIYNVLLQHKEYWRAQFEICDQSGLRRPDPMPHPDDFVLDSQTLGYRFNGPENSDEKAAWDHRRAEMPKLHLDIAEMEALMRDEDGLTEFYEAEIEFAKEKLEQIDQLFPDEETRRQPGFNLVERRLKYGERLLQKAELRKAAKRKAKKAASTGRTPSSGISPSRGLEEDQE